MVEITEEQQKAWQEINEKYHDVRFSLEALTGKGPSRQEVLRFCKNEIEDLLPLCNPRVKEVIKMKEELEEIQAEHVSTLIKKGEEMDKKIADEIAERFDIKEKFSVQNIGGTRERLDLPMKANEAFEELKEEVESTSYQKEMKERQEEKFIKADGGKNRLGLLPPQALLAIGRVLTFGAKKYEPNNWMRCSDTSRYVDAALRHIVAYMSGEKYDPETGEHHLAHAGCCIMFLIDLDWMKENGD